MMQQTFISMTPPSLTGAEFEHQVKELSDFYSERGLAIWNISGVQAVKAPQRSPVPNAGPRESEWIILRSKPDFEGCLDGGLGIKFDCKACSQASFDWSPYRPESKGSKQRQLTYMLERSRFGELCFFLFHWNERQLSKRTVPAETILLKVDYRDSYWDRVFGAEERSIKREECLERGTVVQWAKMPQKLRPALVPAIKRAWGC